VIPLDQASAELLRGKLIELLRRRYYSLASFHEDLAQSAIRDAIEYLGQRKELQLSDSELTALCTTILKRRIADLLDHDRRWRSSEEPAEEAPEAGVDGGSDQMLSYVRVLRAISQLLGEMDPYDRSLLLRDIDPASMGLSAEPLGVSDRVKLSRLRKGLRAALLERFGISIQDELGGFD
jgi:DNA-directed RNA polymerase specialized sigma24 family protein